MSTYDNAIAKGERSAGIDLFKIISMLMVVVLHVLGAGGVLNSLQAKSVAWFMFGGVESVCIIAVNCFALTSGFLYVGKKIKIKNIFSLYLQVLFYSLVISAVVFAFKPATFSIKELLNQILPILSGRYWYFSAYFILFLTMPLLNIILDKADKSFMIVTLIGAVALFGIYVFCGNYVFGDVFHIEGGYSFVWLAVCYLIGGAIKKYDIKNLLKARSWFLLYLASTLLSFIAAFVLSALRGYVSLPYINNYNFLLNLLSSVFLLLFFARIEIKPNKVVSYIAKASFGVYLFHEQKLLKNIAITDKFIFVTDLSPIFGLLVILGSVLAIYIVGTLIEIARQYLFKLIKLNKLSQKVDDKVVSVYEKLKQKLDK